MTDRLLGLVAGIVEPFVDPGSRLFVGSLLVGFLVAMAALALASPGLWRRPGTWLKATFAPHLWLHPSSRMDVQMFLVRQLLAILGLIPTLASAWWISTRLARLLQRHVGAVELPALPDALVTAVYSVVLFVAWDASRFALHWASHRFRPLWQLHQVHHSAEVLTPLTFLRLHPLEAMLYELRGAVVTGVIAGIAYWMVPEQAVQWTLLGFHGGVFLLNTVLGNLRHSHVHLAFPEAIERVLLSPAQHQRHHSADPDDFDCNFGTWLAIWDRAIGSWKPSGAVAPQRFGIDDAERNHDPHDVVSALWAPLKGLFS